MANFPPIQFRRSNVLGRKPTESDLQVGEIALNLKDGIVYSKNDSDIVIQLGRTAAYDSEFLSLKHGFQSADSDIWVAIDILRGEKDSDIAVSLVEHDSDLAMTYHDFMSADSDIRVSLGETLKSDLDSEIIARKSADSDIGVIIAAVEHDYASADSDNFINLVDRIIEETHDRRASDSDIIYALVAGRHDAAADDSDIRIDIDAVAHNYQAADSDLFTEFEHYLESEMQMRIDADSDLQAQISETSSGWQDADSDIRVDLAKIEHDYVSADSDIKRHIDSEIVETVIEYMNSDSEIRKTIETAVHDYMSQDSDFSIVTGFLRDFDSDLTTRVDRDFDQVEHNFAAADSDLFNNFFERITEEIHDRRASDSDIVYALVAGRHDAAADDSDIIEIVTRLDSDLANIKLADLADVTATAPTEGQTLVWDSDAQTWTPGEGSTVGALDDLTDVDVTTVPPVHNDALVWDSDSEMWKPGQSSKVKKIDDLDDVIITNPRQGDTVEWDSDTQSFVNTSLLAMTGLKNQTFVATQGQTTFTLQFDPIGDVQFSRNGVVLSAGSATKSFRVVTYDGTQNNYQTLQAGDRIDIQYAFSSVGMKSIDNLTFADFGDVSDTPAGHGQTLMWDSDTNIWIPVDVGTPINIDGGGA